MNTLRKKGASIFQRQVSESQFPSHGLNKTQNHRRFPENVATIRRTLLLLALFWPAWANAQELERIWSDGEVNGTAVRFAFDTGSGYSALLQQTVQKLGLKLEAPQTEYFMYVTKGKQFFRFTEPCMLKVGPIQGTTTFAVLDIPDWTKPDFEGVIGWPMVTNAVVSIDAFVDGVTFLEQVPALTSEWPHVPALSLSSGLGLEIHHGNGGNGVLLVDTGSDDGVALPRQTWRRWKKAHPYSPLTLRAAYTPSGGFYVYEESWANEISFGPLTFRNVPIEQGNSFLDAGLGKRYEGTIGLAALKRLNLVVDPKHSLAYWKQRTSTQSHYSYNRLAAVWAATSKHPREYAARVIKGGPAYLAGVRDGDVLLEVDGIDTTTSPYEWASRFALPAGTKLNLKLARRGKPFQITATLRDILQPSE